MVLDGIGWYWTVLYGTGCYRMGGKSLKALRVVVAVAWQGCFSLKNSALKRKKATTFAKHFKTTSKNVKSQPASQSASQPARECAGGKGEEAALMQIFGIWQPAGPPAHLKASVGSQK